MSRSSYKTDNQEITLHEGGILYRAPTGAERNLSWSTLRGVKKSVFSRKLTIHGAEGTIPLSFLSQGDQKELLVQFYEMWRTRDLSAAKKNAFDFLDHQRGFAWVMLFMSLLFFLPLGYVMLQDSIKQWGCNRLLAKEAIWASATVSKAKQKRKGHFILTLSFDAGGQTVQAMDQFFTKDRSAAAPETIPVLYAAENPTCWILAKEDGASAHWEKRKFFAAYTSIFGTIFGFVGVFGFLWSIFRFKEKNPHAEAIRGMFQFK